jgi:hypothetical protein
MIAVTPRPPPDQACYPLIRRSSLGSLDWPHKPTPVFSMHFCRHSCELEINIPVGHRPLNHSRRSTLNLKVLWRWASGKKFQLVDMSILSILLSPRPGCHNHLSPASRIGCMCATIITRMHMFILIRVYSPHSSMHACRWHTRGSLKTLKLSSLQLLLWLEFLFYSWFCGIKIFKIRPLIDMFLQLFFQQLSNCQHFVASYTMPSCQIITT